MFSNRNTKQSHHAKLRASSTPPTTTTPITLKPCQALCCLSQEKPKRRPRQRVAARDKETAHNKTIAGATQLAPGAAKRLLPCPEAHARRRTAVDRPIKPLTLRHRSQQAEAANVHGSKPLSKPNTHTEIRSTEKRPTKNGQRKTRKTANEKRPTEFVPQAGVQA